MKPLDSTYGTIPERSMVPETQYVEIIRIFENLCHVLPGLFTAHRCRALP